jgi:hypothetical protein
MLPGYGRSWTLKLTNVFLIRSPERVLASYAKKRSEVTLSDIGFVQQAEIFDLVAEASGRAPAVIDADDILRDPVGMLSTLCAALGICFDEAMLVWPAGPRPFDGVWGKHWYNVVWQSTAFAPPPGGQPVLDAELSRLVEAALPYYERLSRYRLPKGERLP